MVKVSVKAKGPGEIDGCEWFVVDHLFKIKNEPGSTSYNPKSFTGVFPCLVQIKKWLDEEELLLHPASIQKTTRVVPRPIHTRDQKKMELRDGKILPPTVKIPPKRKFFIESFIQLNKFSLLCFLFLIGFFSN